MTTNVSLYAVPAAWFLAMTPRLYAMSTFTAQSKTKQPPETLNPRAFVAQLNNDPTLSPGIRDRCVRAESAVLNGLENLGFFAGAVLAGNFAGLDVDLLNRLSVGYLASRVLYNIVFIFNDKVPALARTSVFMVGLGINWSLFIMAGKALQRR